MNKIEYTSKLYIGFVVAILLYFLTINTIALISSKNFIAIVPITIQVSVLVLVATRHRWVSYGIKLVSLVFIVGSGLQLLGQLTFLIGGNDDMVDINRILRSSILVAIGLALFAFCDRSIRLIQSNPENISNE